MTTNQAASNKSDLFSHASVDQKLGLAQPTTLLRITQGQNQGIRQLYPCGEALGESTSELIQTVGRIQFLVGVGLRSCVLTGYQLESAFCSERPPLASGPQVGPYISELGKAHQILLAPGISDIS